MERIPSLDYLEQEMSERKKKLLISQSDIVKECARRKIDMSLRRLRYNAHYEIFKKAIRVGRDVFYEADYIYPAITCNYLLKVKLELPMRTIKKIMKANQNSIKVLLDRLQLFLEKYKAEDQRPGYYYLIKEKFLVVIEANSVLDLDRIENQAAQEHQNSRKKK